MITNCSVTSETQRESQFFVAKEKVSKEVGSIMSAAKSSAQVTLKLF